MEFCIAPSQLRAALVEIETAEKHGFHHCMSVFRINSCGQKLDQCTAEYSDIVERAHPTDGHFDWGRFQGVTRRFRFDAKKKTLVALRPRSRAKVKVT